MKSVNLLKKWFSQTDLLNDYLVGTSNLGYINDMLLIDWIKHFNRHICGDIIGVYRLLIFDGFDLYYTKDFLDYCIEVKLIPFSLLPYLS